MGQIPNRRPTGGLSFPSPTSFNDLPMAPATDWRRDAGSRSAGSRGSGGGLTAILPVWAWLTMGGGVGLIIAITLVVVLGGSIFKKVQNHQAMSEILAEAEAMQREQEQALMSLDAPAGQQEQAFQRIISVIEQRLPRLSGDDAVVAQVSVNVLRELLPQVRAYSQAEKSLEASGANDPFVARSKEQLDEMIAAVTALRSASKAMHDSLKRFPSRFEASLAANGISASRVRAEVAAMQDAADFEMQQAIQDAEIDCCDHMLRGLDLLKREWGRWQVSSADGMIEFESESASEKFNQIYEAMTEAAERGIRLHQRSMRMNRSGE